MHAEESINYRESYPLSISASDFIDLQRIAKSPPAVKCGCVGEIERGRESRVVGWEERMVGERRMITKNSLPPERRVNGYNTKRDYRSACVLCVG